MDGYCVDKNGVGQDVEAHMAIPIGHQSPTTHIE